MTGRGRSDKDKFARGWARKKREGMEEMEEQKLQFTAIEDEEEAVRGVYITLQGFRLDERSLRSTE